ncbi:hypothetical protein ABPG75_010297 [Micractinium tetrahymenae]
MVESLLSLAVRELGHLLCWSGGLQVDLALIPEEELAQGVWDSWQHCLRTAAAAGRAPPAAAQHQVLLKFAAGFFHPQMLRLAYPPTAPSPPPGVASLQLIAARLQHLELSSPSLLSLEPLAAAAPQLRCLSLRGCTLLRDAALEVLLRLTTLQALDLGGLAALSDAAVFHVAKLPQLAALNLSGTAVGDRSLEFVTYGRKVGAWQSAAGVAALPPEAAAWPPLPLDHLQLAGTRATPDRLAELANLPKLRFLDVRGTGMPRSALGPLQRRFGLQFVQAAVLTDSNLLAAAVVNEDAVLCRCGCASSAGPGGSLGQAVATDLQGWQAEGTCLLLHFDPASGVAGLLAGSSCGQGSQQLLQAQAGGPGGLRTGYRQPRGDGRGRRSPAAAPSPLVPPQHQHGSWVGQKRTLPWQ